MKSERNLASENQNHIAEAPAGAESTYVVRSTLYVRTV